MPELPEVENFRRMLLGLVSKKSTLTIECPSQTPPRTFLTPEQVKSLSGNCRARDVLRKGKLICMVLECVQKVENQDIVYLFLHMGMTGRISTPSYVPPLESLNNVEHYPPPHTYLYFRTDSAVEASFSDPRKFGSVILSTTTAQSDFFDNLAPDALTSFHVVDGLVGQAVGIKALLLDQKRVVSGVGNWVADEVLYQSELHPEQTFLSRDQAVTLQTRLHCILNTAIACLDDRREFPESWLFHCRWEKRASNSGTKIKDPMGRTVVFLKAAGRTCAIVPSIQIKRSQNQKANSNLKKRESDALNADDGITKQDADTISDKPKAKRQRKTGNAKDAAVEGTPAKSKRRSPQFMNLR